MNMPRNIIDAKWNFQFKLNKFNQINKYRPSGCDMYVTEIRRTDEYSPRDWSPPPEFRTGTNSGSAADRTDIERYGAG